MAKSVVGIIGGGLSGLTTAYHLKKENISSIVIEARDRLGGRIHTQYSENEAPIELGATWLGKKHTTLLSLLSELDIEIYEQYMGKFAVYEPISTSPPQLVQMPYNPDPTYRIKGGSSALINRLADELTSENIFLDTRALSIRSKNDLIEVNTDNQTFEFQKVVVTLPPKLFIENIAFEPSLPSEFVKLCHQTHTWMSESIKVALTYARPFWKEDKPIGSIFSNTGLIPEMYDHSNYEASKFALKGFINGNYAHTTKAERIKRVVEQLSKYFGSQVENYISYHETIWRNEPFTHSEYNEFILPHQNNGNEMFRHEFMDGNLLIGGSETAPSFPGYMDGAVESGIIVANKIKKALA